VDWVRLASSLISCNLICDPRCENKVVVPILFLIGRFHLDHLYKWHITHNVTLCMITKPMNKWMFTFCKYSYLPFYCVYLMQGFHHILLDICNYLMMRSSIWQMVRTRTFEELSLDSPEGSVGRGRGPVPRGDAPPPPPRPPASLEQLLATPNDLMRRLIENDECHGAERQQPRHQERDSSYSDFLATHPPVFADAIDPLEADSWLRSTESKFGPLHCTKYQKNLYVVQQLRGAAGAWWASYIATLPDDHHVPWDEFYTAFCAHHLSVGLLCSKLNEFLDLEQGNTVYSTTLGSSTLLLSTGHTTSTRMKRRSTCTV
jgi:hypothetical protein